MDWGLKYKVLSNVDKMYLEKKVGASGYEIFIRPYFTRIISGVFYKSHL